MHGGKGIRTQGRRVRRTLAGLGLAIGALALGPAAASAASVGYDGTGLTYAGAPGELNVTSMTLGGGGANFVFTESGTATLIDGDGAGGCAVAGSVATCPTAETTQISLGDRKDTLTTSGNLAALTALSVDGGPGPDTILGSNGADLLIAGPGGDTIDGQQGNDVVFAGAGNDTLQWDPGDGSDAVEGQQNRDRLVFNASAANEIVELSANGSRLLLTRDVGAVTIDADGVELVDHRTLGGTDTTTVNDLSATDVVEVNEDLAGTLGGGAGDGQPDQLIVNGTAGTDAPLIAPGGGGARVLGGGIRTTVVNADDTGDQLEVLGLAGDDRPRVHPDVAQQIGVLVDGGADTDTVRALGTAGPDNLNVIANGLLAALSGDGATAVNTTSEQLRIELLGGDDTATATGNLAALTSLRFEGGSGADALLAGNGADDVRGGSGPDFIDAQQGNDTVLAGTGRDTMQWDPGDGSDTLEGQANRDRLLLNTSNVAEVVELTAIAGRLRLTRNVGNIVLDADDIELVDHRALGGADTTIINDLTGTDLVELTADLAGTLGGSTGDAAADQVVVNGTDGSDTFTIAGSAAAGVDVGALGARVAIRHQEPENDQLIVHTKAGADTVDSSGLEPGAIGLLID